MYFRGLAECQAKLDVALEFSGVKAVLLVSFRVCKLEEAELDGPLCESCVEVEHVVAAAVVVCASAIVAEGRVPNLRKLAHRGGLCSVQLSQKGGVDRFAVTAESVGVNVDCPCEEVLVARHDVGEVPQCLRRVAVCSNVDVHPAAAGGVALRARLAEASAKFLKGLDVLVAEDGRYQLRPLVVVPCDNADVPLEFPLAPLSVPCAPGEVSVPAGRVLVAARAEEFGGDPRRLPAGDAVHLDLHPDGVRLHALNQLCRGCFHLEILLRAFRRCIFLASHTSLF